MYKVMWSLRVCALVCVCAAVAAPTAAELRCVHPRCVVVGSTTDENRFFSVEDHDIRISLYDDLEYVAIECDGWRALESPAMPKFASVVHASFVELLYCPPPTTGSIADALAALNVTLLREDGTFGNLSLENPPPESPLTARHFVGLERIRALEILNSVHNQILLPTTGFLVKLRSLQSLELTNVQLPAGELDDPPPVLRSVRLIETGVGGLPKAFLALPDLQNLVVINKKTDIAVIFEDLPPALRNLVLHSTNTTLRLDQLPVVEELSLLEWTERRPQALSQCDELRTLVLYGLAAEALPERWVTACPHLDTLYVKFMRNVASLPPKLLEGASALTRLSFSNGVLEILPDGLLDGTPKLKELLLNGNRLHTIPSGTFLGPRALSLLNLSHNRLTGSSLTALAPLTHLTGLNLTDNPSLGDLCDQNGYSPLLNLTRLRSLRLSGTNITRICRDWRENLTFLWTLELKNTKISELQFADFQYTRDGTISRAQVRLEGAPVTSVQFTEDDYKRALTMPKTHAWVRITSKLECDCRMYWTRLVKERAKHAFRVISLLCTSNRDLSQETADNMCGPRTNVTPTEGATVATI